MIKRMLFPENKSREVSACEFSALFKIIHNQIILWTFLKELSVERINLGWRHRGSGNGWVATTEVLSRFD